MLLSENEILYAIAPCTLGFPIKHKSTTVCNHGLMNLVVTLVCCHASCHAKKTQYLSSVHIVRMEREK